MRLSVVQPESAAIMDMRVIVGPPTGGVRREVPSK